MGFYHDIIKIERVTTNVLRQWHACGLCTRCLKTECSYTLPTAVQLYSKCLTAKFRPSHNHPHVRLVRPVRFLSHGRYGYSFKTVQQANKKINGTKAALVPSLTFTCYLISHAAGMVSATSGQNVSPQFGSVTSVKKKLILKFLAVKKLKS